MGYLEMMDEEATPFEGLELLIGECFKDDPPSRIEPVMQGQIFKIEFPNGFAIIASSRGGRIELGIDRSSRAAENNRREILKAAMEADSSFADYSITIVERR